MSFEQQFQSEQDCREYLRKLRWPNGQFRCSACGHNKATQLSRRDLLQCCSCKKQFSLTAGTIFSGCRIPLLKLFQIIWTMTDINNNKSAAQTAKDLDLKYSTTWEWMEKFRTVIESRIGFVDQITVHWSQLSEVLFRRSSESSVDTDAKNIEPTQEKQEAGSETYCSTSKASITATIKYLSTVFHGISRKYVQRYSALFGLLQNKLEQKFEKLVSTCLLVAPISRKDILQYKSPQFVHLPRMSFDD